jgi:ribosomal protein S18 acetylase RimI-like enzyme
MSAWKVAGDSTVGRVDRDSALAAYDKELRQDTRPPRPGWTIEVLDEPGPVLRMSTPPGFSWGNGIFWSDLDASNADAAIAAAVDYFRARETEFEWKHHGYDTPADLPDRLRAAGFVPDEEETLVIGEIAEVRDRLAGKPPPDGVTVRRLREDDDGRTEDWAAIGRLSEAVWGNDPTDHIRELSAEQQNDPSSISVWLAEAPDGTVVCAAWVRFHEGTEFASMWGGSTLAEWRGRGIYQALVARRADEAADRGYRYLQVDCSPDSRPILERLGMYAMTSTTPYNWRP